MSWTTVTPEVPEWSVQIGADGYVFSGYWQADYVSSLDVWADSTLVEDTWAAVAVPSQQWVPMTPASSVWVPA